jgi:hypothetical protein
MWPSSLAPGGGVASKKKQQQGLARGRQLGPCGGQGPDPGENVLVVAAAVRIAVSLTRTMEQRGSHFQNIFRSDFIFCDENLAGTVVLKKMAGNFHLFLAGTTR